MAAKVPNPRKNFQFSILIPGLNPFSCQTLKMGDIEIDSVEHGDTNFKVKTGGMINVGDLELGKIAAMEDGNTFVWSWLRQIQSTTTGGGLLPSIYKRQAIVTQHGADGILVLQTWILKGIWPKKVNGIEFSRMGSENTIETITFSVDEYIDA